MKHGILGLKMGKLNRRDQLISAYLDGLGIVVVEPASAGGPARACRFGDKSGPPGSLILRSASHADLVLGICGEDATAAEIEEACRATGADILISDTVLRDAGAEIDFLDEQMKAWNSAGGLARLNSAFKQARAAAVATHQSAPSYSDYQHSFKLKIAGLMGKNLALGRHRFDGVFALIPDASKPMKKAG